MHTNVHRGTEEDIGSPGAGVTDGCEVLCWELNLGSLKEQPAFLTAEVYLQFQDHLAFNSKYSSSYYQEFSLGLPDLICAQGVLS